MLLPHTTSGRRLVALAAIALTCGLVAVQAAEADSSLEQQHRQLQGQVKSKKADLDDASSALVAARASLSRAEGRLATANAKLARTQSALSRAVKVDSAARARLTTARRQLRAGRIAVKNARIATVHQREELGQFVAESYQAGDPQLMQILTVLQSGTASEISSRLGVIDSVMIKQNSLYQGFKQKTAELAVKERGLAATATRVAVEQRATAAAVERRRTLTASARAQRARVASLVRTRTAAKARAERIMRRDRATLARLKAKDAKIQKMILARKRNDGNRTHTGGGMLLRPVNGPITSPFGYREHPIYHYWGLHDGDDFATPCGEGQVASDSGTVISEYYSDVWGNRLYIDLGNINGHNYTVIYNHTERYAVSVGQRVARGQVVSYTGTTGWSTGCHLHFTVLRDGTAVDPAQYF